MAWRYYQQYGLSLRPTQIWRNLREIVSGKKNEEGQETRSRFVESEKDFATMKARDFYA